MGRFVEGVWLEEEVNPKTQSGEFLRQDTVFRNWISTEDGARFAPEAGRYHLYISHACPWAHRTLIFRKLKNLEAIISVDVVHPLMGPKGWDFATDFPGASGDTLYQSERMGEIYLKADTKFSGRVTVPVLWDKKEQTIVNNESSEIIRIFNQAFNEMTGNTEDFYPKSLRPEIDEINDLIYHTVNNGVYRAGFARTQAPYEEAVRALFDTLDKLEDRLGSQSYLVGDQLTEADWRLFPTLVRFDAVYVTHFKCNLRSIADYPNLTRYLKELLDFPGVRATCEMAHIKHHYFRSHPTLNPFGLVPIGPESEIF